MSAVRATVLLAAVIALPLTMSPAMAAAPVGPVFKDGQAQPVFDAKDVVREELFVRAPVDSDGDGRDDEVHVQVARPRESGSGLRVPVVYQVSPYFGGGNNDVPDHNVDVELSTSDGGRDGRTRGVANDERIAAAVGPRSAVLSSRYDDYFLSRGFAMVFAESLGTGQSTGCPTAGGRNETLGARSVVDWLNGRASARDAAGHPVTAAWATGRVGMIGTSYNGTLPNAVATTGVAGLEAIVPIAAISNWYDYYRTDGVVVAPGGYQGEDADVLADYVYTRADRVVCRPVIDALGRQQDRRTGDYNAFWDERNYLNNVGRVRAAVLAAHGLNDWNVKTRQVAQWYAALRQHGVAHKIWLYQSGHADPISLRREAWLTTLNRWFTRYVYGVANGVEHEPRATLQRQDGSWVDETEWPAPAASPASLWPWPGGSAQGQLNREQVPGSGVVERLFDDAGRTAEELVDAARSGNRLAYFSGAASASLRLSGTAAVDLRVSYDRPAANTTALLVDRAANGANTVISRGWADPRNRNGIDHSEPVVPGQWYSLRVELQPKDHLLVAGHQLGLVLLSSDHDFTLRPRPGAGLSVDITRTHLVLPAVGGQPAVDAAVGQHARALVTP